MCPPCCDLCEPLNERSTRLFLCLTLVERLYVDIIAVTRIRKTNRTINFGNNIVVPNLFDHQDLGIHLPRLCPQLMNHSIYNTSGDMAQRIGFVYVINANQLVLFEERFGFRCENHSKDMRTVFDKVHESRTVAVDFLNS